MVNLSQTISMSSFYLRDTSRLFYLIISAKQLQSVAGIPPTDLLQTDSLFMVSFVKETIGSSIFLLIYFLHLFNR